MAEINTVSPFFSLVRRNPWAMMLIDSVAPFVKAMVLGLATPIKLITFLRTPS